jgi:hypothetical protein
MDGWTIAGILMVGLLILGIAFVLFLLMKKVIDSKLGKKEGESSKKEWPRKTVS